MKLFVKLLSLLLVAALVGPFFIKGPNGAPLWTVRDIATGAKREWRSLTGTVKAPTFASKPAVVSGSVLVYRWRDANGQWHFAGEPPADSDYDTLMIDPDTNALSLTSAVVSIDQESAPTEPDDGTAVPRDMHVGPLPDPEATRQLIEDAKALQDLVDLRARELQDVD